jgi:hypothetical protein
LSRFYISSRSWSANPLIFEFIMIPPLRRNLHVASDSVCRNFTGLVNCGLPSPRRPRLVRSVVLDLYTASASHRIASASAQTPYRYSNVTIPPACRLCPRATVRTFSFRSPSQRRFLRFASRKAATQSNGTRTCTRTRHNSSAQRQDHPRLPPLSHHASPPNATVVFVTAPRPRD